jgi:hypothetical protein
MNEVGTAGQCCICQWVGVPRGHGESVTVGEIPLSERDIGELASKIASAYLAHGLEQEPAKRALLDKSERTRVWDISKRPASV